MTHRVLYTQNNMRSPNYYYQWSARIQPESLPQLQALALDLGYIVSNPGVHDGDPAPNKMLDSLANAYKRDPERVAAAMRDLGLTATDLQYTRRKRRNK